MATPADAGDDPLSFADLDLGGDGAEGGSAVETAPVFADAPAPPPPAPVVVSDAHPPPDEPPPPYESVMGAAPAAAGPSASAVAPPPPPPALPLPSYAIRVTDPLKHGDGVSAYVSYKVRAGVDGGPPSEVIRRFRDFAWLHARLGRTVRGAILPPLPEKTAVMAGRLGAALTPAFVEGRRAGLEAYLVALASHPLLCPSPDLSAFLSAPEEEWALAMARADHEDAVKAGIAVDPAASVSSAAAAPAPDPFGGVGSGGALAAAAPVAAAAKRRLGAAWAGLRGLGASAAAFAAGKGVVIGPGDLYADATEDPAYLRSRDAVAGLEGHLADVAKAVSRAVRKQAEAGAALADLGVAAAALARHEGPDAPRELASALAALADRGGALGRAAAAGAERLNASVTAPLAEAVRSVKCARAAMADRGMAGGALAQARNDVDARRARLTRLRGTPGTREDKLAEAERDLLAAQTAAEVAKAEYDALVGRMERDLPRWEAARAGRLASILGAYAEEQARTSAEAARVWGALSRAPGVGGV